MSFEEKKLLVNNLLEIYRQCSMKVYSYPVRKKSLLEKLFRKNDSILYPDICIDDFHETKGVKAYYYVLPMGAKIDRKDIPSDIRNSWVKIIYGSVFNLDRQRPDLYIKGDSYVAQYTSQALFPFQTNVQCAPKPSDRELAEIYADAWRTLDTSPLNSIMEKDLHYDNDSVFDDMASREEYLDYLEGKFESLRKSRNIQKVQVGRNGQNGDWAVIVKQIQSDGSPIVCGLFLKSSNGLISNISIRLMDLPDF